MSRRMIIVVVSLVASLGSAALAIGLLRSARLGREVPADQGPLSSSLRIVASTDIVGDVVRRIGGDSIELRILVEAGRDPHDYEPTPRAVTAVSDSDIVFISGLGLEEGLTDVINQVAGGRVVAVSEGVKTLADDPHTWMSPFNVKVWVENILAALSEADPSGSARYGENAAIYSAELDELDQYIRQAVSALHVDRRQLVTDHKVFGYFAERYEFRETGFVVPASSTSAETGPAAVAELVELLRATGAPAIFVGVSAPNRVVQLANAVAAETGDVTVVVVQTGSLAPAGEPGDTYLDMMRQNVARIVEALAVR